MKNDLKNRDIFRIYEEVPVEETVALDVDKLFEVVGTSDENIERISSTPYS